jgi:hypothetical protein
MNDDLNETAPPTPSFRYTGVTVSADSVIVKAEVFDELCRRSEALEKCEYALHVTHQALLTLWDPAPEAPRPRGMNGKDWADAFALTYPRCGVPDGLMISWFSNAIMAGYDTATIRYGHLADKADMLQRKLDLFTAARDALIALKHDPEQLG